ncbi:MAG: ABC transporter ATP-binding protein/permease [Candidatus Melainabacteria bacterium]|nr:ABC transporter ATP-binding protein/permease [Candidatus Melainabacteria bacterium]
MRTKSAWSDLKRVVLPYWSTPSIGWGWLFFLLALLLAISFINIRISYSERAVFTALEGKDAATYWHNLWLYAAVLLCSVPIVGSFGWVKSKLEMAWRNWLTTHILDRYLANRNFVKVTSDLVDNPDERIQQDVSYFCTEILTISMALLDSFLAFLAFVTILYLISPTLLVVAIVYSAVGTVATLVFGKRLVGLHYDQQRLEAEFRYNLVYLRDNAEAVGLYNAGIREGKGLKARLARLLHNLNSIVSWQRNLTLFKVTYDYSLVIVPALFAAPLYFTGHIELGMMVQAASSFGRIIGALSVVIAQYQTFARLSAITSRLSDFVGVLEEIEQNSDEKGPGRIATKLASNLALDDLTLNTPDGARTLVRNLSFSLKPGSRLIIAGPSGVGKSSLIRAFAGLWTAGTGEIARPDLDDMMVLPQESYMPLGTLRDQFTYPKAGTECGIADSRILAVLKLVNLGELVGNAGGLDATKHWTEILSPGERQRVAFARLMLSSPKLVLLDEATSSLDVTSEAQMYDFVTATGATIVSVAHHKTLIGYHDTVLELVPGGGWRLIPTDVYQQ